MKVLLVEDERLISYVIAKIITSLGHTVMACVPSAEAALAELEMTRPDFIILDIRLEGEMDGIQAGLLIKEKWGIPLAFASAYADEGTRKRAGEASPVAFLVKPIRRDDLRELLVLLAKSDPDPSS